MAEVRPVVIRRTSVAARPDAVLTTAGDGSQAFSKLEQASRMPARPLECARREQGHGARSGCLVYRACYAQLFGHWQRWIPASDAGGTVSGREALPAWRVGDGEVERTIQASVEIDLAARVTKRFSEPPNDLAPKLEGMGLLSKAVASQHSYHTFQANRHDHQAGTIQKEAATQTRGTRTPGSLQSA